MTARIRQALKHHHPRTFGPAHSVGGIAIRLAPAVARTARPAGRKTGIAHRGRHHRHPAHQRQRALPGPQRLRRQVHRHQRGRARPCPPRTPGPSNPKVYDTRPATTLRGPAPVVIGVSLQVIRGIDDRADVIDASDADEDAGLAAAQRDRVDPGPPPAPPTPSSSSSRCCGSIATASRGEDPERKPGVELISPRRIRPRWARRRPPPLAAKVVHVPAPVRGEGG